MIPTIAIEWFESNYMKLNKEKCNFLISGHKFKHLWINIGSAKIWERNSVTLLGYIDSSLKIVKHMSLYFVKRQVSNFLLYQDQLKFYLSK